MILFKKIKSVYRWFTNVSGGAHGNTRGFHGSLTAYSLQKIFNEVDPYGRNVLDIGFGTGVVLAAALTSGAAKAHGFELPENQANQYIFQAAMKRWSKQHYYNIDISRQAVLEFNDVEEVLIHIC
jgi:ribosomal protein L11 methylase PrmA